MRTVCPLGIPMLRQLLSTSSLAEHHGLIHEINESHIPTCRHKNHEATNDHRDNQLTSLEATLNFYCTVRREKRGISCSLVTGTIKIADPQRPGLAPDLRGVSQQTLEIPHRPV